MQVTLTPVISHGKILAPTMIGVGQCSMWVTRLTLDHKYV